MKALSVPIDADLILWIALCSSTLVYRTLNLSTREWSVLVVCVKLGGLVRMKDTVLKFLHTVISTETVLKRTCEGLTERYPQKIPD